MFYDLVEILTKGVKAEVAIRKYDGKFVVWQPNFIFHEDKSWTFFWQQVGVFNDKSDAEKLVVSIVKTS